MPLKTPRELALIFILTAVGGCFSVNSKRCPQSNPKPKVIFFPGTERELTVFVELACTDYERARGLMYRKKLPKNRGMLFVFPYLSRHSFWMKNTYIPLDMIHIDADHKIVGIIENARPLSTTPLTVDKPSLYVLEVNAFFARDHGIKVGDTVKLEDVHCD